MGAAACIVGQGAAARGVTMLFVIGASIVLCVYAVSWGWLERHDWHWAVPTHRGLLVLGLVAVAYFSGVACLLTTVLKSFLRFV
jgi:hypothetical protein